MIRQILSRTSRGSLGNGVNSSRFLLGSTMTKSSPSGSGSSCAKVEAVTAHSPMVSRITEISKFFK